MNIFLGLIDVQEFFSFNFRLREFFFLYFARPPLPHKFSNGPSLSWDGENYIFPKVTKMGSIFGHRMDYNGVGVLIGQRHIPSKT